MRACAWAWESSSKMMCTLTLRTCSGGGSRPRSRAMRTRSGRGGERRGTCIRIMRCIGLHVRWFAAESRPLPTVIAICLDLLPYRLWLSARPRSSRRWPISNGPSCARYSIAGFLAWSCKRAGRSSHADSLASSHCWMLQICSKQYNTAMELDAHLSSYDHHHKKVNSACLNG